MKDLNSRTSQVLDLKANIEDNELRHQNEIALGTACTGLIAEQKKINLVECVLKNLACREDNGRELDLKMTGQNLFEVYMLDREVKTPASNQLL